MKPASIISAWKTSVRDTARKPPMMVIGRHRHQADDHAQVMAGAGMLQAEDFLQQLGPGNQAGNRHTGL